MVINNVRYVNVRDYYREVSADYDQAFQAWKAGQISLREVGVLKRRLIEVGNWIHG